MLAIHEAQLAEHGGSIGIRDLGLLQSALARPAHLLAYEHNPDAASLATAYAFGIARNHPFIDGNKQTAFVTMELFLEINGFSLTADDASCIANMEALAAGSLPEDQFSQWVGTFLLPI